MDRINEGISGYPWAIGWSEFHFIFWICISGVKTLGFGPENNHETNFGPSTPQLSLLPEVKGHARSIFVKIVLTSFLLVVGS